MWILKVTYRLHQIRIKKVIQWKTFETRGLTIVFTFYREILSGVFSHLDVSVKEVLFNVIGLARLKRL